MQGGIHTLLLVTVALLLLTQTRIYASVENDNSSITLPYWREHSEYVTQCVLNNYSNINASCDWKMAKEGTDEYNISVSSLKSRPLGIERKACLEFWYQSPKALAFGGSELRVLLKGSTGHVEIWTLPAVDSDAWIQEFVSLDITETTSQVVFEATQEMFMGGQVRFDRMGVRKGQCGKQCKPNTQFWTDESTLCLCSGGQLSCISSRCPEGQRCGPQGEIPSGTCTVHSDPHCSTFDGVLYRFTAPCTYVLAKTCSSSDALPIFSVDVVSKQMGNSSVSSVQQVNVELKNLRISLLKNETQRAMVNGIWRTLPLKLSRGAVKIYGNPAAVLVETMFNLMVSYDKAGVVHISLPFLYSSQVCGLCGNFNSHQLNDYLAGAANATALGQSRQTQGAASCEASIVPHKCGPSEEAEYASEPYCGSLLSATGPFAACVSILGVESYFRSCVAGMCGAHGDIGVLCEKLQAYADICQEAGVVLPTWRNSSLCPLQCGENSHYNSCADGCPEACSSLDAAGACGSCEQRCECEPGFQLSGGRCVRAADCGCWRNQHHYEKGELFLDGECEQQCQCMGNNIANCAAWHCAENEVCKVNGGVKVCFPSKPVTCSVYGDPHYITFDGRDYDFQGGCNYTLTTTCGDQSPAQFTVTGRNLNPIPQNLTRSKLEAVALQIEGLHVIMNQNRQVHVNNNAVTLPHTTNGSFGSIRVYKKIQYVVLEATFGLRMIIDGQNRLFLQLDERYYGQLCGLCGTYSNAQADDFIRPDGSYASGAFDFGNSWRVMDDTLCTADPDQPRSCTVQEKDQAETECYKLLEDVFSPCNAVIHPLTHINSCVYDYCATGGDQHTLCNSLESYVTACQVAGVELSHWQNNTACVCPLNCNFDQNMCGWQQLVQDSFDWTRHSGLTPSNSTGPNHDHTTGEGFYLYTEGDSVSHGDSARLISPTCHHSGTYCLQFWYHMYGSATAMALNIYQLHGGVAKKLWTKVNPQGPEWLPAFVDVDVPDSFQIIVEGIRGSSALSDVSIDDISIHFGSCSDINLGLVDRPILPPTTTEVLHSHPDVPVTACHLDCSFDGNLCGWSQMVTDAFDWTWQSGSTPTLLTGPSADHTGGEGGHYLYIEASTVVHGDTARLVSSECSDHGPQCLQFWYHMYGSADTMGLHVYLVEGSVADAVWWKRNDQGNMWHLAQVDLITTGPFQIIFEGRRGSNEQSDVSIDDVKLYRGRCSGPTPAIPQPTVVNVTAQSLVTAETPVVTETVPPYVEATESTHVPEDRTPSSADTHQVCQVNCYFEQDLCEWNQLLTDVFDWTRHSGSTPTMLTGPSSDHTIGNGHYLYIEANSAAHGDTARLLSTQCSDFGPQCLQFWYHMYGSADTMGLHVYLVQSGVANAVWRKRNDQGNMWHLAQVDLISTRPFQILFEGRIGSNDQSDVAVDDVTLHHGHCANLTALKTTTSPAGPDTSVHPLVNISTTAQPQPTSTTPVITATIEPQTTATTKSPTTPVVPTPPGPELSTTVRRPSTTERLEHSSTTKPERPTVRPQPPSTASREPQSTTTVTPQPLTTEQSGSLATSTPQSSTTVRTSTTTRSQPSTTEAPGAQTTVRPQLPTKTTSQLPPTERPEHSTSIIPQPTIPQVPPRPTSEIPMTQTTGIPLPPTTAQPQPPTTVRPQPPPTDSQEPQTTPRPETTATMKPRLPTEKPTSATPRPEPQPTTNIPRPMTSENPGSLTTEMPVRPSTTAWPRPQTTSLPLRRERPRPQNIHIPTPSCQNSSHNSTCITACQPTCEHLYGPPHCREDQSCVPGCVCDEGFVLKQSTCVPIQQCGCVDRDGNKHHLDEVWYTSHCSQKCRCKIDDDGGKTDCDIEDGCDGDAVCLQDENGQYYCKSTDFSECTIEGDPEYITFDDMKYRFAGEHSYVLVQTTSLPANLPEVYIAGINAHNPGDGGEESNDDSNEERDGLGDSRHRDDDDNDDDDDEDDEDNWHRQRLIELKIQVYNHTVEFKKNRRVILDGRETRTPVSPAGGLEINKHSSRIYLKTDFGLSVEFDGQRKAEITLPHIYKRKVGGLCGNLDGKKKNDLIKPDGSQAVSVQEFGESWRVTEDSLAIRWRRSISFRSSFRA